MDSFSWVYKQFAPSPAEGDLELTINCVDKEY
jgi:hypothetical protein